MTTNLQKEIDNQNAVFEEQYKTIFEWGDGDVVKFTELASSLAQRDQAIVSACVADFREMVGEVKCRRCSLSISECSKKRWKKPLCVVNGAEWDEHVIGYSSLLSLLDNYNRKI